MDKGTFAHKLLGWYEKNKRKLPWRKTKDPYKVWLSEIILQQTRVEQGLPYYEKFVEHFPNVESLANAPEQKVLKLWQGLGYYSRARNLHAASKIVAREFNGVFPNTYDQLLQLKGVGEYTAAAVASFCFNEPKPVLDGNVYRLLARTFGISDPINSTKGKKAFQLLTNKLIDVNNPGNYNQAIMEFGATQCKPANPNCGRCVFKTQCYAYAKDKIKVLPVKLKKQKIRKRYFNYFVFSKNGGTWIKKREGKDIWQHLYEFPMVEATRNTATAELLATKEFVLELKEEHLVNEHKMDVHVLSHQKIHSKFIEIKGMPVQSIPNNWVFTSWDELENYPIPRLMEKYVLERR